ncbi:MAG: TetR/AcrR family transcriptional regulator [Ilumatobacteraceae bacterium]
MSDRTPRPIATPRLAPAHSTTRPARGPDRTGDVDGRSTTKTTSSPSTAARTVASTRPSDPTSDVDAARLAREAAELAGGESDGRRLRRQRNRDAVVTALLDLYREGNLDPSAEEVAQRSGVSARSVFRYFDDVRDLANAALDRAMFDVAHLIPIAADASDSTDRKIEALLDERQQLWEENAEVLLVVRLRAPFQPALAASMATSRQFFRQQVADLFAPELERVAAAEGEDAASSLTTALHLLCTFEAWRILRVDQAATADGARAAVADGLRRLLRGV